MAIDPARAARERKQKIFVAVGGVVLLLLLAFQLPKLLGGPESTTATPTTDTTLGTDTTPVPTPVQPVTLADTDRRFAAAPGKLRSFSVFSRKDPFEQQVVDSPTPETTPSTGGGGDGKSQQPSKGFKPDQKPATTLTVISVNGVRQALATGAAFPAADPVFVLVAEQLNAKTVVIGIRGGSYSSGAKTTKLRVGKSLVLVNTTTGARYKLKLIAVGTGETAPSKEPKS